MSVESKFKEIVSDIFNIDQKDIKRSTRFVDDLNAKSVDIIALIAAVENKFGIRVPSQEANKNKTVGQAIDYIKRKKK